ncbi:hypothetical protein H696_01056 [Fonticula alba]|uniref:Uncharacterized protein n=1 Tax=Fonticula alba TaxID=691883 RepID=A0A058ZB65_FONAL|nr:hypothetical protein H696_01056 [Fonticula alba]KCV71639.1 hypothetical protein H696_01056 [Fonticula alba]|eukprot:XP_009493217.1 hypothetical protein H696_01056 [Fonticula alba]
MRPLEEGVLAATGQVLGLAELRSGSKKVFKPRPWMIVTLILEGAWLIVREAPWSGVRFVGAGPGAQVIVPSLEGRLLVAFHLEKVDIDIAPAKRRLRLSKEGRQVELRELSPGAVLLRSSRLQVTHRQVSSLAMSGAADDDPLAGALLDLLSPLDAETPGEVRARGNTGGLFPFDWWSEMVTRQIFLAGGNLVREYAPSIRPGSILTTSSDDEFYRRHGMEQFFGGDSPTSGMPVPCDLGEVSPMPDAGNLGDLPEPSPADKQMEMSQSSTSDSLEGRLATCRANDEDDEEDLFYTPLSMSRVCSPDAGEGAAACGDTRSPGAPESTLTGKLSSQTLLLDDIEATADTVRTSLPCDSSGKLPSIYSLLKQPARDLARFLLPLDWHEPSTPTVRFAEELIHSGPLLARAIRCAETADCALELLGPGEAMGIPAFDSLEDLLSLSWFPEALKHALAGGHWTSGPGHPPEVAPFKRPTFSSDMEAQWWAEACPKLGRMCLVAALAGCAPFGPPTAPGRRSAPLGTLIGETLELNRHRSGVGFRGLSEQLTDQQTIIFAESTTPLRSHVSGRPGRWCTIQEATFSVPRLSIRSLGELEVPISGSGCLRLDFGDPRDPSPGAGPGTENYTWNKPGTRVRGLLAEVGTWVEHVGTIQLDCVETGLRVVMAHELSTDSGGLLDREHLAAAGGPLPNGDPRLRRNFARVSGELIHAESGRRVATLVGRHDRFLAMRPETGAGPPLPYRVIWVNDDVGLGDRQFGFSVFASSLASLDASHLAPGEDMTPGVPRINLAPTDARLRPDLRHWELGRAAEAAESRAKLAPRRPGQNEPRYFQKVASLGIADPRFPVTSSGWTVRPAPGAEDAHRQALYWSIKEQGTWLRSISEEDPSVAEHLRLSGRMHP